MNKSTSKEKLFGTTLITLASGFWVVLAITMYWETVSLKCLPNPVEVICKIDGEPYPGGTRIVEIPKSQLVGVKIIDRMRQKKQYRIGLIKIDRQQIPLTRNFNGDVTIQLEPQIDRIAAFINDPNATSLTIKTQRNFPPSVWMISLVIFGFSGWCLKRLWIGFD